MLWTSFGCLLLFINSIVWNDNVTNWAPVWCDICAHFLVGASVGIPASALCVIRRLYYMTKLQRISVEDAEKRCEIIVDISISIGFPCVIMVLAYVVQGRRFMILEEFGCYLPIVNTLSAYFLIYMWPLVIGLISQVYAILIFRRTLLHKQQLRKMHHAGYPINSSRYWRLMLLCCMEIIFTVPLSIYVIVTNVLLYELVPYSWESVHSDFSQIVQIPTDVWQRTPLEASGVESSRWFFVLCAFVVFAFFGWAEESRNFYRQAFRSVFRHLGYSKTSNLMSSPIQFEASTHLEFSSPSLRSSGDEVSKGDPPRLPPIDHLALHMDVDWLSKPVAPPELAHGRNRWSLQPLERNLV
ncbi:putative fungal pheromoneG-protein-coupled receptor [Chiua virens]|nr:putative fungal pheromoneG-protein-coupled receptor [Chiua virens]